MIERPYVGGDNAYKQTLQGIKVLKWFEYLMMLGWQGKVWVCLWYYYS